MGEDAAAAPLTPPCAVPRWCSSVSRCSRCHSIAEGCTCTIGRRVEGENEGERTPARR